MDSQEGDAQQELVRMNKDTDSFSITIPDRGSITGIPAETLPELRDQLHLIGGWLSCWYYLDGPPMEDEEKAKPEQALAWHTSDFIEEALKLIGYDQLRALSAKYGKSAAIGELVSKRLDNLDKANERISSTPQ